MTSIGHNNPPKDRTFKRRWAAALFAHPKKPAGAIALAFKLYSEMDGDGRGAIISDRDFCLSTGTSERSCQNFKAWLITEGFIHIHVKGARGRSNEFIAHIPDEAADEITASIATIPNRSSAPITGKLSEDRQPLPPVGGRITAMDATDLEITAMVADGRKTSPAPTLAEENIIIYNKNNNLPLFPNQIISNSEQDPARGTLPHTAEDFARLSETLLGACNGALDNPVNCQGLASLATPIMWLEQGCDLQRDILPTLQGYGKSAHGRRIRTWNYFTGGIQKARDQRLAGMPVETPGPKGRGRSRMPAENEAQHIARILRGDTTAKEIQS